MTAALTQDNNRPAAFWKIETPAENFRDAPPPAQALADLCRISLTGEVPGELPDGRQAEEIAALAIRARLTSPCELAYRRADRVLPPVLADAHRAARARAAISNGRVMGLARIAFPSLTRAGIAAIGFKGPFQHRQLHGDPFFARSGDLDLLVRRADFARALAALESEGFARHRDTSAWWTFGLGEVHLVHRQGGVIDLHHRLQQPGCPPPRDTSAFLRSAQRDTMGGVEVAFPSRVESVLICALNLAKEFIHRHPSARYAYGFAAGLLAMDAAELRDFAALAADQNLTGTAGFAAMLCGVIFDLDLPLDAPAPPRWADRDAVLAMVFDPEAPATRWPRRRAILWAMCSGTGGTQKAAEFSRVAARMIASDALRRVVPSGGEG